MAASIRGNTSAARRGAQDHGSALAPSHAAAYTQDAFPVPAEGASDWEGLPTAPTLKPWAWFKGVLRRLSSRTLSKVSIAQSSVSGEPPSLPSSSTTSTPVHRIVDNDSSAYFSLRSSRQVVAHEDIVPHHFVIAASPDFRILDASEDGTTQVLITSKATVPTSPFAANHPCTSHSAGQGPDSAKHTWASGPVPSVPVPLASLEEPLARGTLDIRRPCVRTISTPATGLPDDVTVDCPGRGSLDRSMTSSSIASQQRSPIRALATASHSLAAVADMTALRSRLGPKLAGSRSLHLILRSGSIRPCPMLHGRMSQPTIRQCSSPSVVDERGRLPVTRHSNNSPAAIHRRSPAAHLTNSIHDQKPCISSSLLELSSGRSSHSGRHSLAAAAPLVDHGDFHAYVLRRHSAITRTEHFGLPAGRSAACTPHSPNEPAATPTCRSHKVCSLPQNNVCAGWIGSAPI